MLGINLNERGVMLLHQKAAPIVKSKAIEGYGHYSITDKWDDVFQQLTQYGVAWGAPVGMIIPLNSFLARRFDGITCYYYIECPDCAQTFEQRPAGLYAIIRDYANYGEAKPIYGRLLDFITEQHMRPCSDAVSYTHLPSVDEDMCAQSIGACRALWSLFPFVGYDVPCLLYTSLFEDVSKLSSLIFDGL